MKDSWCEAFSCKGKVISGAAAREARISSAGGMDNILRETAQLAFNSALTLAQAFVSALYGTRRRN